MNLNDHKRLETLKNLRLLDTPPDEAFDRLTRLAAAIIGSPVSLISLVDEDRQFFKSQIGLTGDIAEERQTPLSHSFCKHVVESGEALIVEDAREHPLLRNNPAVEDMDVISYAGFPLNTSAGVTLGSFCVIDSKPRHWSDKDLHFVEDLAAATMREIELREAYREAAALNLSFQREHRLRQDLTDMLVHDLRSPVSAVISALDSMQSADELHTLARDSANKALNLINDLLILSRLEDMGMPVDRTTVSLKHVCEQTLTHIRILARMKSIKIVTPSEDLDAAIDAGLTERILANFLSNAVKFSPSQSTITIEYGRDEGGVWVSVTDEGPGIPKEAQEEIFEKFQHVGANPDRLTSSGIGLSFCKLATEAQGGFIGIKSSPGEGSTFWIKLPE